MVWLSELDTSPGRIIGTPSAASQGAKELQLSIVEQFDVLGRRT
jgi:hypothetical protein